MGMLLIVPKQSEMDDQLGAPLNIKNHFIYEEECIFFRKMFYGVCTFFEEYIH